MRHGGGLQTRARSWPGRTWQGEQEQAQRDIVALFGEAALGEVSALVCPRCRLAQEPQCARQRQPSVWLLSSGPVGAGWPALP